MALSHEDSLRLNVLLRQNVRAIRINESSMCLYALLDNGEVKVRLNPVGGDDRYLKFVRELCATHFMGSPQGYPTFLSRWTRMGQIKGETLRALLKLGEPEAVVAVACAPNLTPELAECAWWALPSSENARWMLGHPDIVSSELANELTDFLLEFLPFETDPQAVIDSVRLVLQPGLMTTEQIQHLWKSAGRKVMYFIGFMQALPDSLPANAHPHYLADEMNAQQKYLPSELFTLLQRVMSAGGQAFIHTALRTMDRLPNQDAAVALYQTLASYFRPPEQTSDHRYVGQDGLQRHLAVLVESVEALGRISEDDLTPVLARTDAVGSVLRKKLEPINAPVRQYLQALVMESSI